MDKLQLRYDKQPISYMSRPSLFELAYEFEQEPPHPTLIVGPTLLSSGQKVGPPKTLSRGFSDFDNTAH